MRPFIPPLALAALLVVPVSTQAVAPSETAVSGATTPASPSDFNGDGVADLAIGAPGEDRERGQVVVLYGGAHGITAVGDERWSLDTAGVKGRSRAVQVFDDGAVPGTEFGRSLASADFDADGFADVAVGGTYLDSKVSVLYGTGKGLSAERDQRLSVPVAETVAAGDIDGDGYADLIVGSPNDPEPEDLVARGSVTILFGGDAGLSSLGSQRLVPDSAPPFDSFERFGDALAVGDLDGDSHDDIAVGGGRGAGAIGEVSVYAGSPDGAVTDDVEIWDVEAAGIQASGFLFGNKLAIGDFDGNGIQDLVISMHAFEADREHGFLILPGSVDGPTTDGSQHWVVDSAGLPTKASDRFFGQDFGAGDFDGDGFEDLVATFVNSERADGFIALYGSPTGLGIDRAQRWTLNSPGVPGKGRARFEPIVSADYGRSDGDDVAVTVDNGRRRVLVLYGQPAGLSSAGVQTWSQDSPGVKGAAERCDAFGFSLSPGTNEGFWEPRVSC